MKKNEQSNKTILYIELISDKTIIKLFSESGTIASDVCEESRDQSEKLLLGIDALLNQTGRSKRDLSGIAVNTEQSAYTGSRVIATTANLLGFSLNVPVLSVVSDDQNRIFEALSEKEDFADYIVPVYKNDPIITRSKSRLR